MKFINFVEQYSKTILHIVITVIFIITLVLGFKSGFLNKNSQVSEALYGYASALNHVQFPDKNSFFIQDISISEKPENHPYPYTHNFDLGFVVNRLILALGVSEESSYVYANAFTAIVRVASLYLLYFLLLEITGSALFAILTIVLIGFDYYNFYNTHYSVLRGNSFVAYILFLFSIVKLSKGGRAGEWFYLFLAVVALWVAFLIGFMTTSTFIFTMFFLTIFRVTPIGKDRFVQIFMFGVVAPFLLRVFTSIWSTGLEFWAYDDWLTKSTKMAIFSNIKKYSADLYYTFYDANRVVGWPSSQLTINDVIAFFSKYLHSSLYYFKETVDSGAFVFLIIFSLWIIVYYLFYREKDKRDETFLFTIYFLLTALLTIVLNMLIFPTYYHFFELVYSNYIGLLVFTLPAAYFLSQIIMKMIAVPGKINVALGIIVLSIFIFLKVDNNLLFYRFLPIEKDRAREVLKPFEGKSAVTNSQQNFIYSKILNRPCTFNQFNIYIKIPGLDKWFLNLYEHNPFPLGPTWYIHSRDQLKSYEYNFPELTIFNFNIYEWWIYDTFIDGNYSFTNMFKKNTSKIQKRYQIEKMRYIDKVINTYGVERVLYRDDDFIIIDNNPLPPTNEIIHRRYIWDKLVSIQQRCFDKIINLEYNTDRYEMLTKCIQSEVGDETYDMRAERDFYTMLYNRYIEIIRVMNDPTVAREKLIDLLILPHNAGEPPLPIGNMSWGHTVIIALIVNYQIGNISSVIDIMESSYYGLPPQLRKYALSLKFLSIDKKPVRDVWQHKLYKDLYKKML